MHIKRHGFCKLNGSLGSDINSANATILIGKNSQLGDSNSLSDGDGKGTLSGVSEHRLLPLPLQPTTSLAHPAESPD